MKHTKDDADTNVNLAEIYRELADVMQDENPEFKRVMKKVKKAASLGEYSVRVDVSEEVYDWVRLSWRRGPTPTLIRRLIDTGFRCDNAEAHMNFFGNYDYNIRIIWSARENS